MTAACGETAACDTPESLESVRTVGPFDRGLRLVYRLCLDDGTLIEQADEDDPLCFDLGDGTLASRLEERLIGLEIGREYCFILLPGEGYPLPQATDVYWLPRAGLPPELELEPGRLIELVLPGGDWTWGRVLAVEPERVQVDCNHPLAGLTLRWTVRVLA